MDERIFNNYQKPAFNLYCNGQQISTDIPEINFDDIANDDFQPPPKVPKYIEIPLKKNTYKTHKAENIEIKSTFADGQTRSISFPCLKRTSTKKLSRKYARYMNHLKERKVAKSLGLTYQQSIRTRNRVVKKFLKIYLLL